ncbi:uncharacterized protein [Typha angustifolia]|uniref:uncharacterized protein isoform X2 n=1 Tax=Typha angustifolia TaxID=59011 RepID=UPI003C2DDF4F
MGNPRSDSLSCRRIVLAFLDFLNSVELAPGVDSEALEVSRDCLEVVFMPNSLSTDKAIPPGLLLDLFNSWEAGEQHKLRSDLGADAIENKASCSNSTSQNIEDSKILGASNSEGSAEGSRDLGVSRDELFGRFYAALDKINFFRSSPAGVEDPAQIAKATQLFDEAVAEMENNQGEMMNLSNLGEVLKSKGNQFMRLKQYHEAIELYTYAIALCGKNAVYYCNRAAAYTHIHRHSDAIEDCLKSIEIDPSYSKAYSRLGSAYFAQGNYHDALYKGYLKASQLDPSNRTIQENIEVTKMKLLERVRAEEQNTQSHNAQESRQTAGSTDSGAPFTSFPVGASPSPEFVSNIIRGVASSLGQESASQSSGPPNSSASFTSFPTNASIPINLSNIFGSMTSNHGQESTQSASSTTNAPVPPLFADIFRNMGLSTGTQQAHERSSTGNGRESGEPDPQADANIHLNFGEAQGQVSEVLRSVMQMFSSQTGGQEGMPRGSDHT